MKKPIYLSKTFWVNFILAILAVIALISPELLVLLGINSTQALSVLTAVTGVLNIFLRLLTDSAVSLKINKTLVVISFVLFSSTMVADTVRDSADTYNHIVNAGNGIILAVPDTNVGVSAIKLFLFAIGGFCTSTCIHFFGKRNKARNDAKKLAEGKMKEMKGRNI